MPIYVPSRGPTNARIMIIGEMPGAEEVKTGKPFVGFSGAELSRMLHEAGLLEADCFITNVGRFQPPGNDETFYISPKKKDAAGRTLVRSRYLKPEAVEHLNHLEQEIATVRPNVIIACGDLALWATTGEKGITRWRGSVCPGLQGVKVVPTFHPAAILRQWGYRAITVQDFRRAKEEAASPDLVEQKFDFIIRPSYERVVGWFEEIFTRLEHLHIQRQTLHVSCDIETRARQIACVGFAISPSAAICIPFMCITRPEGYWSEQEELEITLLIRDLLLHPAVRISGQNFLYDAQYLSRQWGFTPRIWHDTMVIQHVLFPGFPETLKPKSLGFLSTMYCKHPRFWKDEGKLWTASVPEEQLWEYNCKDACRTFEIAEAQVPLVSKMGLEYPASFQMKLWWPLLKMMLRGIRQDGEARQELQKEIREYIDRLQNEIDFIVGHPLNVKSIVKMKALFYDDLKMKRIFNRKTKAYSLDDASLETLGNREPLLRPLISLIQHRRSAGVFASTFLDARPDTDKRMHCTFNPARAKTFRLTSSEDAFGSGLNLQNQPRNNVARPVYEAGGRLTAAQLADLLGTSEVKAIDTAQEAIDDGYLSREGNEYVCSFALPNIRKLFIPDPGMTWVNVDLDRADLQVVVWEADDAELKQMLREGVDIHSENAKVVRLTRQDSKIFIHATDYGASARKLAETLGKSVDQMEEGQKRWFSAHPGIREWHRRTEGNLPRVVNKFGYKIHYFDRVESLLPKALAWIPQSTVAIVINHGLVAIDEQLPEIELLLQVHDDLSFQLPTPRLNYLLPKALDLLRVPVPYSDPLTIPVSAKVSDKSWGAVKEWKAPN